MKKRIFALVVLSFMTILSIMPFLGHTITSNEINTNTLETIANITIEKNTEIIVSKPVEDDATKTTLEDLINQMDKEIQGIPYDFYDMKQKQQWFIAYKEVISKYPKELHMLTIYDAYTEEELDLLFRIVQAEVGDEYDFDEKANVTSVIFNRLNSKNYHSITDVLTAKNQFSTYWNGRYRKVEIDEKTILACEYVFLFGDTTGGCYGFQMKYVPGWNGWEYQFKDDCHYFYKRKENY